MIEAGIKWAESLGYRVGEELGAGCNAQVFAIENTLRPDTLVLKVTGDSSEYAAMLKAMNAQAKGLASGLVRTYRVAKIQDTFGYERYYGFVMERLQPLSADQWERAKRVGCSEVYSQGKFIPMSRYDHNGLVVITNPLRWDDAIHLNLAGQMQSMREAGIKAIVDWKAENIMARDGLVVISDLGCSS